MAQIRISESENGFSISFRSQDSILLSKNPEMGDVVQAKIWDDTCDVVLMPAIYHQWFSEVLGISCRLAFMPEHSKRPTKEDDVGLADGYHTLLITREAIDELNERLNQEGHVSIRNFRPNLVMEGTAPHAEDAWVGKKLMIGDAQFTGAKLCGRCKIPTIDPETSEVNPLIMANLSSYRFKQEPSKGVYFGLNLVSSDLGKIVRAGDQISLSNYH